MSKTWLSKLTSRKFLLAAISMIAGIVTLCGADGTVVDVLASAAMTVVPAVVYCIIEGRIDANAVKEAQAAIDTAAAALGADEPLRDAIAAAGDLLAATGEDAPGEGDQ